MKKLFVILLLTGILPVLTSAQQELKIRKSEIIETINGKQFYMHFIKSGETLFEIARTYEVDIEDIYENNPGAKNGIKTGQILKIPQQKSQSINKDKNNEYFYHQVQSKETLYGIAKKYGTTVNEILAMNLETGESVKEGQSIKIPAQYKPESSSQSPLQGGDLKHQVQAGETLYGISKIYDVSVYEIKKANPGLTENLKAGQEIIIPGKDPSQYSKSGSMESIPGKRPGMTHAVVAGETLYSISKSFGVDPDSIKKYNPTMTSILSVGQILYIPEKSRDKNYIYHTAEKNDKLQNIAEKFGVSYAELLALNPEMQKKVTKGQKVKIPVKPEEKKLEQPEKVDSEIEVPANASCNNLKKNMQTTYKVALMLPLFLEDVDSLISSQTVTDEEFKKLSSHKFIQFYEGFIMAVDSMKSEGLKMDLHVYDVDNSTWKINSVLKKPELAEMDLIIGPFYAESFKKMADFAATNNIKIVNPLSTRDEIINGNPEVFKLKPSVDYQAEQLAEFIVNQYAESNVIIIRQNSYKYQEEVSYIKNYLNSQRASSSYIKNKDIVQILDSLKTDKILSDNTVITRDKASRNPNETTYVSNPIKEIVISSDSSASVWSSLSRIRNNFIIILSEEKVFCQDMMSRLNKLSENHKITLFGAPEWKKFSDLEITHLLNMNTHFIVHSLVNYNNPAVIKWVENFRKNYATEPSMNLYAFDGFDAGWYFLNALFRYGKEFEQCLDQMDVKMIQTQFRFEHLKGNGYQNTFWNIGRHYDYQFIPARRY